MSVAGEKQRRIESAMHLVRGCAASARRQGSAVSQEELESAGYEALVLAAERFDPARGEFEPFAFAYVRAAMKSEVRSAQCWRIKSEPIVHAFLPMPEEPIDPAVMIARSDEESRAIAMAELRQRVGSYWAAMLLHADLGDAEEEALTRRAFALGHAVLERAVEALPDTLRIFYRRFYRQDRPVREIARELGCSERTVFRLAPELRAALVRAFVEAGLIEPGL